METEVLKQLLEDNLKLRDFKANALLDKKLDDFFGLEHQSLTNLPEEYYPELESVALSTPYSDYYQILKFLRPDQTLVDIGAGYCRGSLLSEYLGLAKCISIEVVKERTEQATHAMLKMNKNATLILNQNLATSELPRADAYYFYFAKGPIFYQVLQKLLELAKSQDILIFVCESHGDMLEFFDSLKNTKKIQSFVSSAKRHHPEFYAYELRPVSEDINWKQDLSTWFLKSFGENYCLEFEYYHQLLKQKVKTLTLLNDLDLVLFQGMWGFQHRFSNRIYDFKEFQLNNIIRREDLDLNLLNKLEDKELKKSRLLLLPQPAIEKSSGGLEFI